MPTDKALWFPNLSVPTIADINFDELPGHLENLIVDVDNTLARPIHCPMVPMEFRTILRVAKKLRFRQVCLLSNMVIWLPSREQRIRAIQSMVGADHVVCAYWPFVKPHSRPFTVALEKMGALPTNTVVIGDQLHTDIRGGNRLGMFTIKVEPLGPDPLVVGLEAQTRTAVVDG